MANRTTMWLVLALLLGLSPGVQGGFVFTTIAERGSGFTSFPGVAPTLNNAGQVAFRATRADGVQGIYLGSGGPPTEIATTGGQFNLLLPTVVAPVNDSGTVAFAARRTDGGIGIYTGNGGPVALAADTPSWTIRGGMLSINASGTIAYVEGDLKTAQAGVSTIAVPLGGLFPFLGSPVINNAGAIGFFADLGSSDQGSGFFRLVGNAVTPITVFDATAPTVPGFTQMSMNESGTVAFTATDRDRSFFSIYTGDGGELTKVVDTSGAFSTLGSPVINDAGEVAFFADLLAGGGGIFVGPDPVADRVIAIGDALDGSTVTALAFSTFSLNDNGEVAFFASLADGRSGIFRADPQAVPEPSSLALMLAGAGCLISSRMLGRTRRVPGRVDAPGRRHPQPHCEALRLRAGTLREPGGGPG